VRKFGIIRETALERMWLVTNVCDYYGITLVGRFNGKYLKEGPLSNWIDHHSRPTLECMSVFHVLIKGCMVLIFRMVANCDTFLKKIWN
jgi:hypothetical protein